MSYRAYNFDKELELHAGAAATTATGVGQVASAARELAVGAARFEAVAVINVTALKTSATNETYRVQIRGAAATGMSNPVELASVDVTGVGRHELAFVNVKRDTIYPFLEVRFLLGGTDPSMTSTVFATKVNWK